MRGREGMAGIRTKERGLLSGVVLRGALLISAVHPNTRESANSPHAAAAACGSGGTRPHSSVLTPRLKVRFPRALPQATNIFGESHIEVAAPTADPCTSGAAPSTFPWVHSRHPAQLPSTKLLLTFQRLAAQAELPTTERASKSPWGGPLRAISCLRLYLLMCRERETSISHLSHVSSPGMQPKTRACGLARNRTPDTWPCGTMPNTQNYTGQAHVSCPVASDTCPLTELTQ